MKTSNVKGTHNLSPPWQANRLAQPYSSANVSKGYETKCRKTTAMLTAKFSICRKKMMTLPDSGGLQPGHQPLWLIR